MLALAVVPPVEPLVFGVELEPVLVAVPLLPEAVLVVGALPFDVELVGVSGFVELVLSDVGSVDVPLPLACFCWLVSLELLLLQRCKRSALTSSPKVRITTTRSPAPMSEMATASFTFIVVPS